MFQHYLLPLERVLWTGRPKQGLALHPSDLFMIPFSLLWLAIVLFMMAGTWNVEGAASFDAVLIVFVVIGLYFALGRFVHDAIIRRSIVYAVTDHRVLVLRSGRFPKFTSLDIKRLPTLELSEHGDGTGSIRFEPAATPFLFSRPDGMDLWLPSLFASKHFFRIEGPRQVYQLIRRQSAGD